MAGPYRTDNAVKNHWNGLQVISTCHNRLARLTGRFFNGGPPCHATLTHTHTPTKKRIYGRRELTHTHARTSLEHLSRTVGRPAEPQAQVQARSTVDGRQPIQGPEGGGAEGSDGRDGKVTEDTVVQEAGLKRDSCT